jgi:hypothetical protein
LLYESIIEVSLRFDSLLENEWKRQGYHCQSFVLGGLMHER